MRLFFLLLFPSATLLLGCARGTVAHGPGALWVARHGGLCDTGVSARPQAALQRLVRAGDGRGPRIATLASDTPAAFAWPDGSIFVTRGLVGLLDDAELTAAVAHELGHLMGDGRLRSAASLGGGSASAPSASAQRDACAESRADAVGSELLRRAGVATDAMPRMLEKVKSSTALPPHRAVEMQRRIDQLTLRSPGN